MERRQAIAHRKCAQLRTNVETDKTKHEHRKARPVVYFLVLLAVNFMWAFQFSGAKIATERLGPVAVAFVPVALSALLLIPVVLVENARRRAIGTTERRP